MQCLIYGLIDPRDMMIHYIGQSTTGMQRPRSHRYSANRPAGRALTKWIEDLIDSDLTYRIVVLESVADASGSPQFVCWWNTSRNPTALHESERWWIAAGRAFGWPLVNRTTGGEGTRGFKHSEHSKQKMRARRHAEASIAKMRQAKLGRKHTEATRAKMRATHGTPAARLRMRQIRLGTKHTADAKVRMRGRAMSAETRRKLSEALKVVAAGRPAYYYRRWKRAKPHRHTAETKKRISATLKSRFTAQRQAKRDE